jgi:hypothetical protein
MAKEDPGRDPDPTPAEDGPYYAGDLYVLQHLPTGRYFDETRGGYSRWDPKDRDHGVLPPRVFLSLGSARRARTAWLAGVWETQTWTESEGWEHPTYTVQGSPCPGPVPEGATPREAEDVAVVRWSIYEHPLP